MIISLTEIDVYLSVWTFVKEITATSAADDAEVEARHHKVRLELSITRNRHNIQLFETGN